MTDTMRPACACFSNPAAAEQVESIINTMAWSLGAEVFNRLRGSDLCPAAYVYAATQLAASVISSAYCASLDDVGSVVDDKHVLTSILAMLDDGRLVATLRQHVQLGLTRTAGTRQ